MKILHVGKFYSPIEGGIESITRFVVETLRGNVQRIISFNNSRTAVDDDVDTVPVVRASSSGVVASQPLSLKYFFELRRSIRMFQPDVVHFHYPNPLGALYLLLSIRKENKLIVHWHSDVVAQSFLHSLFSPVERFLLKRSDAIIATSPLYRDASRQLRRHREKVTVIPCSIDETRLDLSDSEDVKVEEIRKEYGGKPIVFFIGRHVEYKGIRYLLEAERLVKRDCVFVIAGQGPLTALLKEEFKSSRIHWIGRLDDGQMRLYYHAASIFAFPSITRNEAFGVVLAEAMYCGCPPVTFTIDGSGVNWVSQNGVTGIEVANRDVVAYAAAIDRVLSDSGLLRTYSDNGVSRVNEMFTGRRVADMYLRLYESLVASAT